MESAAVDAKDALRQDKDGRKTQIIISCYVVLHNIFIWRLHAENYVLGWTQLLLLFFSSSSSLFYGLTNELAWRYFSHSTRMEIRFTNFFFFYKRVQARSYTEVMKW